MTDSPTPTLQGSQKATSADSARHREGMETMNESDNNHDGCDCTEICSMGPTCPGGILAGLPGSGCSHWEEPRDQSRR